MTEINATTEGTKLFNDLNKPSLENLSYVLRHPDMWPTGFVWDYRNCNNCAMGLAHQLWDQIPQTGTDSGPSVMAREFAMNYTAARSIFLGGQWCPTKTKISTTGSLWWKKEKTTTKWDLRKVTPDMVADQIDKYLATAK